MTSPYSQYIKKICHQIGYILCCYMFAVVWRTRNRKKSSRQETIRIIPPITLRNFHSKMKTPDCTSRYQRRKPMRTISMKVFIEKIAQLSFAPAVRKCLIPRCQIKTDNIVDYSLDIVKKPLDAHEEGSRPEVGKTKIISSSLPSF